MAAKTSSRRTTPQPVSARGASGTRAVPDCTESFILAESWLGGGGERSRIAERRAEAIIESNHGMLRDFGVSAAVVRRRGEPGILLRTSTTIGAIPLLSPVSGRPDFGLIVEPRFRWASAGEMLAGMGFRVVPELLPLPELPQSERRVPPWVLSSIVLARVQRMLDAMQRRFSLSDIDDVAPRGAVNWGAYATTRIPLGLSLSIPCRVPDLRDDDELRAAIHWVIRRHRAALLGQTSAGLVVFRLLLVCDRLLVRVQGCAPKRPTHRSLLRSRGYPISARVFREGLQAIEWTVDERGLAGLSDLSGLAWRMNMDVFFEAWVETIADAASRRTASRLSVGRRGNTRVPLDWTPPSLGSQRSLVPDLVVERSDVVVVIDAKYKRHAEEIERLGWRDVDEMTREDHRDDVLQALAYSTLFDAPRVVACLAYPASPQAWAALKDKERVLSRATVRSGARKVELALMAVPLSGQVDDASSLIERLIKSAA